MRVLIIEDDDSVAAGIVDGLSAAAFETERAGDAATGLTRLAESAPDIVVLDLGLPDRDGTEVVRAIRASSTIPIIVVSARSEEIDRVLVLELGADDYLVKPFGIRELLARIRAVSRRTQPPSANEPTTEPRRLGALTIDERSRRVLLGDEVVHFTPTEFDLLVHLSADPGTVHRRADILREVWHTEWYGATKTLDAHVAAIRRKLGDPAWIESVRGVGFRFEPLR